VEILYSNGDFAVCIKPVGLDAEHEVPTRLQEQLGGEIYTLHRLDKNVGGVMVYARNRQTASALSKAIAQGDMVKEYLALVHGTPPSQGDWENLLFKDSRKNKVFVVNRQRANVKYAHLTYCLLRAGEQSLVRIRLHTAEAIKSGCSFPAADIPWWVTISTAVGIRLQNQSCIPAVSHSPTRGKCSALKRNLNGELKDKGRNTDFGQRPLRRMSRVKI